MYGSVDGAGEVALTNLIVASGVDGLDVAVVDWMKNKFEVAMANIRISEMLVFDAIIILDWIGCTLKGSCIDSLTKHSLQILTTGVALMALFT